MFDRYGPLKYGGRNRPIWVCGVQNLFRDQFIRGLSYRDNAKAVWTLEHRHFWPRLTWDLTGQVWIHPTPTRWHDSLRLGLEEVRSRPGCGLVEAGCGEPPAMQEKASTAGFWSWNCLNFWWLEKDDLDIDLITSICSWRILFGFSQSIFPGKFVQSVY